MAVIWFQLGSNEGPLNRRFFGISGAGSTVLRFVNSRMLPMGRSFDRVRSAMLRIELARHPNYLLCPVHVPNRRTVRGGWRPSLIETANLGLEDREGCLGVFGVC